jgi:hypothetical protein
MMLLELDSNGNPVAEYTWGIPLNVSVIEVAEDSPTAQAWRVAQANKSEINALKEMLLTKYNTVLSIVMGIGDFTLATTFSSMRLLITDLLTRNDLGGVRAVIDNFPASAELSDIKSEMLALLDSVI